MTTKDAMLPTPAERAAALKARRQVKMARSAHAYVRGNTKNFYDWLEGSAGLPVPAGPAIWICGDCHAGNIGPIASAKGTVGIQIRDLDQTVVGNPAHDLIRLGLSMASAARGSDLPGVTTARMMEQIIEGYEQSFGAVADAEDEWPEVVQKEMKAALKRKWKDLARERIEDTTPTIPLGKNFWPLAADEREGVEAIFATDAGHRLVTALKSRPDDAEIEVVDAAYWVKGCSSLGLLRCAVLVSIGGKKGELCLVDVKEAVPPLAPRNTEAETASSPAAARKKESAAIDLPGSHRHADRPIGTERDPTDRPRRSRRQRGKAGPPQQVGQERRADLATRTKSHVGGYSRSDSEITRSAPGASPAALTRRHLRRMLRG